MSHVGVGWDGHVEVGWVMQRWGGSCRERGGVGHLGMGLVM